MESSLEPKPLPTYRIPICVTIDGTEQSGYLRPVDNREPCQSYMAWIGEKWIGTIHHFNNGWHLDNEKYEYLKETLGEAVMLWHQ